MTDARLALAKMTGSDLIDDAPAQPGEYRQVLPSAAVSKGTNEPQISEAAQALLIMYGCQAQWVINYWRITRRNEPGQAPVGVRVKPGHRYRIETGVGGEGSFEEWQEALRNFATESRIEP